MRKGRDYIGVVTIYNTWIYCNMCPFDVYSYLQTLLYFIIKIQVTDEGACMTTQGRVDFQPFCGHFPTPQMNLPTGSARDRLRNC